MKFKKVSALASSVAPGVIFFCDWLAVFLSPGYKPLKQSISVLALEPGGLVQVIDFFKLISVSWAGSGPLRSALTNYSQSFPKLTAEGLTKKYINAIHITNL